jgi:hypothetical protein
MSLFRPSLNILIEKLSIPRYLSSVKRIREVSHLHKQNHQTDISNRHRSVFFTYL